MARPPAYNPAPSPTLPRGQPRRRGCRRAAWCHLQRHQEDGLDRAAAGGTISNATKSTARGRTTVGVQPGAISNASKTTTPRVRGCRRAARRHLQRLQDYGHEGARLPVCSPAPSPTPPSRRHEGARLPACSPAPSPSTQPRRWWPQDDDLEGARLLACSPTPSPLRCGAPKTAALRLPACRSGAISSPIEPRSAAAPKTVAAWSPIPPHSGEACRRRRR
jgi:hypothetical protein